LAFKWYFRAIFIRKENQMKSLLQLILSAVPISLNVLSLGFISPPLLLYLPPNQKTNSDCVPPFLVKRQEDCAWYATGQAHLLVSNKITRKIKQSKTWSYFVMTAWALPQSALFGLADKCGESGEEISWASSSFRTSCQNLQRESATRFRRAATQPSWRARNQRRHSVDQNVIHAATTNRGKVMNYQQF